MENKYFKDRKAHLEKLKLLNVDLYPASFRYSHLPSDMHQEFDAKDSGTLETDKPRVRLPGRVVNLRLMGKAGFADLSDGKSKVQIYVKKDLVGEALWEIFRNLDLGDMLGVEGAVFRTRTNELTVKVEGLTFLAKSFLPPPEKWHGLQDVETRFRKRCLDLMSNPECRLLFERRSLIIKHLRAWMEARGFLEVETPMMHPIPGGASAKPFITHHETLGRDLYLRIAPELYLKRLLVGGFTKIYEINRNFRNEGLSHKHNPEFTMLESYEAYADYEDVMAMSEESLDDVRRRVLGESETTPWGKETICWKRPWRKIRYSDLVLEHNPDLSSEDMENESALRRYAEAKGFLLENARNAGEVLAEIFDHSVESHLLHPTFVTHFPKSISPLAKVFPDAPGWAQRFELFIGGMEMANAFSELNDPLEQKHRFEEQVKVNGGVVDEDYIEALMYAMPPAGGYGLGIDRLTMLLMNAPSIREVILFPSLRPATQEKATP